MSIQYQILSPVQVDIMGDSVTDAIKKFIKMNHTLAINNLILQDADKHMYAKIRYFQNERKHKIGIDVYPTIPVNMNINNQETIDLNIPLYLQGSSGLNMNTNPIITDGQIKNMPIFSYQNKSQPGYIPYL